MPSMHQPDQLIDPPPDSPDYISDVVCGHGKLNPNGAKSRSIISPPVSEGC
jgi:hypothetical protein